MVPQILAERTALGARYGSIHIEGEVKISVALSRRAAHLYRRGQETDFVGGTNVLIVPNLDTGNLLFHLYATRYPEARKFSVMFGLRFQGVDLPMDSTAADAALAIKACVLRLHRFGHWHRTPKDTFFPRHRILAINPGSTSTEDRAVRGRPGSRSRARSSIRPAELQPFEGKRIVEQYAMRKDLVLKALTEHGLTVDDLDAVSGRGGLLQPIPHGTYARERPHARRPAGRAWPRPRLQPGRADRARAGRGHGQAGLHRRPRGGGRGARARPDHRHEGAPAQGHQPRAEPDRDRAALRARERDVLRVPEPDRLPHGRRHHRRSARQGPLHRREQRPGRRGPVQPAAFGRRADRRPDPPVLQRPLHAGGAAEAEQGPRRPDRPAGHGRLPRGRAPDRRRRRRGAAVYEAMVYQIAKAITGLLPAFDGARSTVCC